LQHAKTIVKNGGIVVFAQTMEQKNSIMGFLARFTKPLLTFFLRIDFGKVTYESDFYDLLNVRVLNACLPLLARVPHQCLICSFRDNHCSRLRATRL
jgi:hypothetical protein